MIPGINLMQYRPQDFAHTPLGSCKGISQHIRGFSWHHPL